MRIVPPHLYEFQSGQTSYEFRLPLSEWHSIQPYNGIKNPNAIRVGQKIKIPASTAPAALKKGDRVKVLNAVTYDGKPFRTYYDTYDVIQVSGARVVIGVGATVTAAVNAANLRKV